MRKTGREHGGSPPPRKGSGGLWLVLGAAMLCPVSKLVILASMGGALGGLLGNKWFLAGVFALVAVGAWFGVSLVRKRGKHMTAQDEQGQDAQRCEKKREYAS